MCWPSCTTVKRRSKACSEKACPRQAKNRYTLDFKAIDFRKHPELYHIGGAELAQELNLNRGFVELGSYALNRLRRKPIIEFYAWNAPPTSKGAQRPG